MAVMDYSLVQRIIDGTGQILDTTPGSPDSGSYVTEAQLRDWIKAGILFSGYYYNGNFYSDSGHTSPLAKVEGALYVDKTNSNKALYVCLSSTYQSLTEEAQVQAIIDGLNDGTIVPLKAKQDQYGNVIDTTYETKADANDLKNALTAVDHRVQNLESAKGDYVPVDSDKGVISVPSGKGKWAVVEGLRGVSRVETQAVENPTFDVKGNWTDFLYASTVTVSNNVLTAVENNSNDKVGFGKALGTVANHSYLCLIRIDSATSGLTLEGGIRNFLKTISVGFNALVVTTNANSTEVGVASTVGISGATVSCSLFNVKDLNIYFGTSDLSFLGATDSAKLATIQTYYPWLLEPSEYGNSLVDSVYEGVKSKDSSDNVIGELSLPTPITLRSAGTVAEEFDLKSGEVTRTIGEVDYGDVEWMMGTSGGVNYFYPSADLGVVKASVSSTKRKNVMALGFTVASSLTDYIATTLTADKTIVISNGTGVILIRDDTYSTPWDFKTGHIGEKIRYELATPNAPTQLSPIQNPTILTESGGTISAQTEEPIDGNFSVGFITL